MANKITTIVDFQVENAKSAVSGFRTAVGDAEGALGKLKAGVGSLGDSFKAALAGPGGMAIAGGVIAAAGTAAFGAVSKFSELGVEIGKFADATGLSTEESSRWIEVAGDIGIDAGTLEGVIGKMNKAIGTTPGLFRSAGIEIAHAKDGTVDANQTFLNAIDTLNRMQDPAAKAALGAKLFGKGWQSVAELVGEGSDKIVQSLKAVEGQKVFDEAKVEKARKFRAAMDDLHDSVEDLVLTMGTQLEPVIEKIVEVAAKATNAYVGNSVTMRQGVEALGKLKDEADAAGINWRKLVDAYIDGKVSLEEATASIHDATAALTKHTAAGSETDRETRKLTGSMGALADTVETTTQATDTFKLSINNADGAYQSLTGHLDDADAWAHAQEQMIAYAQNTEKTDQDTRDLVRTLAEVVKGMDSIPDEKKTKLYAELDQGNIDYVEGVLANLARNRAMNIDIIAKGGAGFGGLTGARAAGGPVSAGGNYLVGENGPEVVHMGGNGTVIPNGSGGDVHVTINMPPGSSGEDVVRAIRKYESRNGPGWRS